MNDRNIAKTKPGDYILITDGYVWVQHVLDGEVVFAQAVYNPEFVHINEALFERVC